MEGAISLIFVIPGKKADSIRSKFVSVIHRYIAGDTSLVREINANSQSVAPVNQIARNALGMNNGMHDRGACQIPDSSTISVIKTVAGIINEVNNQTLQAKEQTIRVQSDMIEFQQRNVDLLHSLLNQ